LGGLVSRRHRRNNESYWSGLNEESFLDSSALLKFPEPGSFEVMRKVNTNKMEEVTWSSPKGKFGGAGKEISEELGRKPGSTDFMERHPFDVEIMRISPGKTPCPYHSHSAQWEFYHVISGCGIVRDKSGQTRIEAGDAFMFGPGEPHQLINDSEADLVIYVVADNPMGESCHYPDSSKWLVRSPERRLIRSEPRSEPRDYYDGEE
jgi:uncharacterized cupin superfamily protein